MYYLLVYDIEISEDKKNKLNKVAKECENYGVRVQNSVFELNINSKDLLSLKNKLTEIIDKETDSIRIYELGKNISDKISFLGKKEVFEISQDAGFFF